MFISNSHIQKQVNYSYERQESWVSAQLPLRESPGAAEENDEVMIPTPPRVESQSPENVSQPLGEPSNLFSDLGILISVAAMILEELTGRKIELVDVGDLQPLELSSAPLIQSSSVGQPLPQLQLEYMRLHEVEQLHYQTEGFVTTGDGRQIQFNFELNMARELEMVSASVRAGVPKDPLLLVLPGGSTNIEAPAQRGLAQPSSGAGYLMVDKNGDGELSGEEELIGGTTGEAFQELASLDSDGNGFIDEGDEMFSRILFYQEGSEPQSLLEVGVGALSLQAVNTPYQFKEGDFTYARMRASSFALMESGQVAGLHQIDLFE